MHHDSRWRRYWWISELTVVSIALLPQWWPRFHVVIWSCFVHSRVKDRLVIGLNIKEKQGRRKHQKIGGGGTGFQGHFWIKKHFPVILYQNCTFLAKIFFKTSKLPNKKGIFDVNPVFIATLACTKKSTFHHKKGHFLSFENGTCPLCPPPPGSYAPEEKHIGARICCLHVYLPC
jgi:hypothetical protein